MRGGKGVWLDQLAEVVKEIQRKVADLTPDKLSQHEAFVTTALHATEIAMRTHQQEKLEALRNAVVNAAIPGGPDQTLQQMFLSHVDSLTPVHLKILSFFSDPGEWGRKLGIPYATWRGGAPAHALEHSMPELAGKATFYDQVIEDLVLRRLLTGGGFHLMTTAAAMLSPRTTVMGEEFLRFISRH